MKVNVCVNGAFRYPGYIQGYERAGALGAFYYAHRRSTTPERLGLQKSVVAHNLWGKEYALQGAWRLLPGRLAARAEIPICDRWQHGVIRRWRDCDSVEAVIGAVADRVLAHARNRGSRTLGHPVCSHPASVSTLVGQAYRDLGLDPAAALPSAMSRRLAEIELCDRLLVDSTFVGRSFERAGVAPERIAVIPARVDLARFHPRAFDEIDRGTFRVVCVGTVTPRKAQHVLLRAWRRLGLPRAELVLVGPPGRDAAAVTRGFEGSFIHHARLPNASLRALLVTASAFVLVSAEDGFGQAPLEAMACGVPVIVSENVGMAELLTDGRDGFVIPAFDAERLAERIALLHRDAALARAMGVAAAATARRYGSWEDYTARVLALHASLPTGNWRHTEAA